MKALIDTNVFFYSFDPRDPQKQQKAIDLLSQGIANDNIKLAHQTIVEFVSCASRQLNALNMDFGNLVHETEDLFNHFEVLFPTKKTIREAMRGMATYQFSWYDAHMWAMAQENDLDRLYSEDFQHERHYGGVQVMNPFI